MLCFYHSADNDGHCSGAIVKYFNPDCELIGYNYGDAFPWDRVQGQDVVMVDVSLQPWSDMQRLAAETKSLTWIDHHKTAYDEYWAKDFPNDRPDNREMPVTVRYNPDKAACEIAWEYYASLGGSEAGTSPQSVFWLGRYDIWKHSENPGSLEFQYGIRMYNTRPDNQEFWQKLFKFTTFACQVRDEGELLLRYETEQNRKFAGAFSFETELDGLRCIAVNKGFTNSLVFDSVYDPAKHDAMLSFCWRGGRWNVSLYSTKPEIDVSAVCKARGGGGHKGASGFQTKTLPFLLPYTIGE